VFKLDVALAMVGGRAADFLAGGVRVAGQLSLDSFFEPQFAITLLSAPHGQDDRGWFRVHALPVNLTLMAPIPRVTGLSGGLGGEMVALTIDRRHDGDSPTVWLPGLAGRAEYRLRLGRVTGSAGLQAVFHPPPFRRDGPIASPAPMAYPSWTFGANLGLQFGVL
jgi:hypothetical protein